MWHAQGAYVASKFLPEACPLVDHLIMSYEKYHLRSRAETPSTSKKSPGNSKQKDKKALLKSKLMFKKPKSAKHGGRNETTLGKSKSIKLLNLYVERSKGVFPKKMNL